MILTFLFYNYEQKEHNLFLIYWKERSDVSGKIVCHRSYFFPPLSLVSPALISSANTDTQWHIVQVARLQQNYVLMSHCWEYSAWSSGTLSTYRSSMLKLHGSSLVKINNNFHTACFRMLTKTNKSWFQNVRHRIVSVFAFWGGNFWCGRKWSTLTWGLLHCIYLWKPLSSYSCKLVLMLKKCQINSVFLPLCISGF